MGKVLKDMTFDELVDWAAGKILKDLIAGQFRQGVYAVCSAVYNHHVSIEQQGKTPIDEL